MSALVFDYGKRHIGVAAANIGSRVVTPLTTVSVNNQKQCRGALAQIIDQWHPEMLVVGLPLNMDDSGSAMSDAAREFGQKLASWFKLARPTLRRAVIDLRGVFKNRTNSTLTMPWRRVS